MRLASLIAIVGLMAMSTREKPSHLPNLPEHVGGVVLELEGVRQPVRGGDIGGVVAAFRGELELVDNVEVGGGGVVVVGGVGHCRRDVRGTLETGGAYGVAS